MYIGKITVILVHSRTLLTRHISYKYNIGNHVWESPLCKLHKCFDSYMSHSITVFPEGSFIRDLCLMRDDYTVFNNCAITKELFF